MRRLTFVAPIGYRWGFHPEIEAVLNSQDRNPLHGKTLEQILTELVEQCGWETLGQEINIRCFNHDPSMTSSLKFLRRTPWAREKVESFYLFMLRKNVRDARQAL